MNRNPQRQRMPKTLLFACSISSEQGGIKNYIFYQKSRNQHNQLINDIH